jgi:hypothetical protein
VKGHFDLRNVSKLQASDDPAAGDGAIEMHIAEKGAKRPKRMILSFKGDAMKERGEWLALFCSAVEPSYVGPKLQGYVDEGVTQALNSSFGSQAAISRKGPKLSFNRRKPAAKTEVLTPRTAAPGAAPPPSAAQPAAQSATQLSAPRLPAPGDSSLDTPREQTTIPSAALPSPGTLPPPSEDDDGGAGAGVGSDAVATPPALPPVAPEATDASSSAATESTPPPPSVEEGLLPQQSPATGSDETFEITVPEGVVPGARLQATTPAGVRVKLVVPEGAEPGMLLTFQVPEAKRHRRRSARQSPADAPREEEGATERAANASSGSLPQKGPETASASPQQQQQQQPTRSAGTNSGSSAGASSVDPTTHLAATKMQSTFRGHVARNEQQEIARKQWLRYHMQPEVAEWEEALALAVSAEEEAAIEQAQMRHEGSNGGVGLAQGLVGEERSPQDHERLKWLKHYIGTGDFERAMELALTQTERARVLKARSMAGHVRCACVPDADDVEAERAAQFKSAIKSYDWEVAETLAISPIELQDVADSRLRVAELSKAIATGNFDLADQYVISHAEAERVGQARARLCGKMPSGKQALDAAAKVQALARGKSVRGAKELGKVEQAAVKLQSIVRGHISRDAQQEGRRQEWLRYYSSEGQYKRALALAVTQREVDAIRALEAETQTTVELQETCWCFSFTSEPVRYEQPTERAFVVAIKQYNWAAAEALVEGPEDRADLHDSKARLELIDRHVLEGDFDEALEYAITEAEAERIRRRRDGPGTAGK